MQHKEGAIATADERSVPHDSFSRPSVRADAPAPSDNVQSENGSFHEVVVALITLISGEISGRSAADPGE